MNANTIASLVALLLSNGVAEAEQADDGASLHAVHAGEAVFVSLHDDGEALHLLAPGGTDEVLGSEEEAAGWLLGWLNAAR